MKQAPRVLALALASPAPQDWPHWRGPSHDGSSAVSGLPAELSREKGVRWRAEMPGPSAATPIAVSEKPRARASVRNV